ncbi:MAG: alpha/beta hydrolase domain-containing protein, partial [Chloroflexi bacterium]|nr:alpha/beta hydrolase domain-containing protein [Chloroflexota bacterium]
MPVTGFDVKFSRPHADGKSWGDVGRYEELRGTLRFAIDPQHPANERITDIELAPRNSDGRVAFSADVSIILPVDRSKANGRMILDVVNRGNRVAFPNFNRASRPTIGENTPIEVEIDPGDGFLMRHGYVVVACGWQMDAPNYPALITLDGPDAVTPNGDGGVEPITGQIYSQLQSPDDTYNFLLSDKGHRAYPALDMEEPDAYMEVRDEPDGEPTPVPREDWRFGRIDDDGNYVADPDYVCARNMFQKGRLYQVVYTTTGARVLGLSFAALRDCTSWIKHGIKHGAAGVETPVPGIKHAYAYGRSQTGRYLRTYIHNDFNLDEDGREALDGVIANVAGGMRGEFNQRFGQNSKDRNNMLAQLFPFASTQTTDPETEEVGSLHARLDERGSNLKVFYTNSSAEYHRGDASLLHTDPDGRHDVDPGPNTRIYHFTGTEHGLGMWPPSDTAVAGEAGQDRSQNLRNIIDYSPLLRACLVNLDRWVVDGIAPPPSSHPRLDDGSAVPTDRPATIFGRIPSANYPAHHANPRRRDFGLMESREQVTTFPPRVGGVFGSLVSAVDADGNEIAGVTLPEIAVPIAATTGWTLRHPAVGGETQLLVFGGGTIPFAATRAEREISGDPRPSIEERYASKDEY